MPKRGIDISYVRNASKAVRANKGSGSFFKPGQGENIVRLYPFHSSVRAAMIADGRLDKDDSPDALEVALKKHYKLDNENPLCQKTAAPTGEAHGECEFCDRVDQIRAEDGDEPADRSRAQVKYAVNLVALVVGGAIGEDNPITHEPRMMTWDAPSTVMEGILDALADAGNPNAFLGSGGRDLRIVYDKNADPTRKYKVMFRDPERSKPSSALLKKHEAALLTKVKDLHAVVQNLPEWYKVENGLGGDEQQSGEPAKGDATEDEIKDGADADASAKDDNDPPFDPEANTASESTSEAPAEPPAEDDAVPEPPAGLPKGVEAFWSPDKKKFYFRLPNGTTTWKEEVARASATPPPPAKPAAKAPAKAVTKPADAGKKNAAPAKAPAKKGGKK